MSARAIPLFHPFVSASARERVSAVFDSGWLGYGPQCLALERAFTAGHGGWSLATSSCTTALYLAALLCRDGPEGERIAPAGSPPEVIVPAMTFISSAMAFAHAGFRVKVADVDRETLTLTAAAAERMLTPATRAIVVVHLYGQYAPDMAGLRALAERRGLALIEDCAHRIDLADKSTRRGDFACFSFNAVKELPGAEGGLLWARDPALEHAARAKSNSGLEVDTLQRTATTQHRDYDFSGATGLKLRSNDVSAALVLGALDDWPALREARRRQFEHYDARLSPLAPDVVPMARGATDSCLMYVVRTPRRARLRQHLAAKAIATSVHYPSLARHALFARDADPGARDDALDATIVTLPTSPGLTAAEQDSVAAAIADAFDRRLAGLANAAD